jgi:hypothetical protein
MPNAAHLVRHRKERVRRSPLNNTVQTHLKQRTKHYYAAVAIFSAEDVFLPSTVCLSVRPPARSAVKSSVNQSTLVQHLYQPAHLPSYLPTHPPTTYPPTHHLPTHPLPTPTHLPTLPTYLPTYLQPYLPPPTYLPYLPTYYLCACPSIYYRIHLSTHAAPMCLPACLPACLHVYLPTCLSFHSFHSCPSSVHTQPWFHILTSTCFIQRGLLQLVHDFRCALVLFPK